MSRSLRMVRVAVVVGALLGVFLSLAAQERAPRTADEGVALAIVFDTSGSMKDPALDAEGRMTPKYQVAGKALRSIIDRLEAYASAKSGSPSGKLQAGLITFTNSHAAFAVRFGAFDATAMRGWTERFRTPDGATPLGEAVALAAGTVLHSPSKHKHILVVTDGENTAGPDPVFVLPGIRQRADRAQAGLGVHFVAFDMAAKVFAPLKRLGVTVVEAADEKELHHNLEFILEHKILLEDEEPVTKPTPKKP